mgnify:CR=1 FL=1
MSDKKLIARLDDLEIKYAFQAETLDSLNETVTKQWHTIEQLQRALNQLEGRIVEISEWSVGSGDEPPPPHY